MLTKDAFILGEKYYFVFEYILIYAMLLLIIFGETVRIL